VGVDEHTIEVAGAPIFYRRAPAGGATPLFLHSVPTSSDDWTGVLEVTGGLAPDLPGFGRSSKAAHLTYSLPGYVDFVESFLTETEESSVSVVGHGWGGAIGLAFAQRYPDRVERIAIIDALPLVEGFEWPRVIRRLRRFGVGELLMGATNERRLARTLRLGSVKPDEAWPAERIDAVWAQFDQGTQRAILRLHRSIDPRGLADAGAELGELDQPTLIMWGERDPWLAPSFADAIAEHMPKARVVRLAEAGHWPWLDRPAVVEQIAAFVGTATDS
jgi:4,5:9,10-diseco-3-hydroxy-5,9,17-trioxoandrosta-1(10),2-diene-4-oate hydrolase